MYSTYIREHSAEYIQQIEMFLSLSSLDSLKRWRMSGHLMLGSGQIMKNVYFINFVTALVNRELSEVSLLQSFKKASNFVL